MVHMMDDAPIEVVVEDLHSSRLDPPRRLFGDCDEDWGVRFTHHEAFFTLPFELVSATQTIKRASVHVRGSSTHSSHLKLQRNDSVPVYFSSTTSVGLYSSRVLNLVVDAGAVAVISSDSDRGSGERRGQ